jgi:hypothetical protein
MIEEYKLRLERLGINAGKPITFILEDLLVLTEFLYEESEKTELERFRKEIKRLQTITN